MPEINLNEVANHEAGHAVIGYLFYSPVETVTIVPGSNEYGNYFGITICDIPCPLFNNSFENESLFPFYLKIALYSWAGEYFQKKISSQIDESGLKVDRDALSIYFDDQEQINALHFHKSNILELFCAPKIINEMVNKVAEELLRKSTLTHKEIEAILSMYHFDYEKQIEQIMDKYYLLIYKKYKELISFKQLIQLLSIK